MTAHKCIGPASKQHSDPAEFNDSSMLHMYHEHRRPGWYEETVRGGNIHSPANLRRWMRIVTQEVHRRGLTP